MHDHSNLLFTIGFFSIAFVIACIVNFVINWLRRNPALDIVQPSIEPLSIRTSVPLILLASLPFLLALVYSILG